MIKFSLAHFGTGKALHTEEYTIHGRDERILSTTTSQKAHSVWKNVALDTEDELIRVATPDGDGTLEITDLIIGGDEKATGAVTVQFTDADANTAIVGAVFVASDAANVNMHFVGKVEGWRAAYLEALVTGDSFDASVTAVYIKHLKKGVTYADWDSKR